MEELASQLGLPVDINLDEPRRPVKEKWTTIQAFSKHSAVKSGYKVWFSNYLSFSSQ
jgi:hypothetical protein